MKNLIWLSLICFLNPSQVTNLNPEDPIALSSFGCLSHQNLRLPTQNVHDHPSLNYSFASSSSLPTSKKTNDGNKTSHSKPIRTFSSSGQRKKENKRRYHEYCIIGAGPAGLQLGQFLASKGRDYVIYERQNLSGMYTKQTFLTVIELLSHPLMKSLKSFIPDYC